MIDINTLYKNEEGQFVAVDDDNDEEYLISEKFPISVWNSPSVFKQANIRGYEPMTAKELDTEAKQNECLNSADYFIEEKFDGTRALLYFLDETDVDITWGYCRVFSRRISKKTNFYVENTDSLPQFKTLNRPELSGTILDGEMFINGLPFKEVSSTLNCLWDKAIDRQLDKGFITLHAFDILFYKGIDLRKLPLERRKVYLHHAVEEANCDYLEEVKYYSCGDYIDLPFNDICSRFSSSTYPNLYECVKEGVGLTPRAYYENIISKGGEGVILKPKKGLYHHKRGWEYSKIKKFLTRELIVTGFSEPTREYQGKAPKDWEYYEGDIPVTKHYYNHQVGNLLLGVLIPIEIYESLSNNKKGLCFTPSDFNITGFDNFYYVMLVCECSGFDDETREYFTRNRERMIGRVVEVKANELFKDSGKLRHPRYLRMREDKSAEQCTWQDHINT